MAIVNCEGKHGLPEERGLTFTFQMVEVAGYGLRERAFCISCGEMVRGIVSPAADAAHEARMALPQVIAKLAHLDHIIARKEARGQMDAIKLRVYRIRSARRAAGRRVAIAA